MGFWTISIGPVKEVTDKKLDAALNVIVERVRSYRPLSEVMIGRYALEKRRLRDGEIEALEEIVASTCKEVETISIALRELADPLMNPPQTGEAFHDVLDDSSGSGDNALSAPTPSKSKKGTLSNG